MTPQGTHLIAGRDVSGGGDAFAATDPETGKQLHPEYHEAFPGQVQDAVTAAREAADDVGERHDARARLLRRIADGLEGSRQQLVERCKAETALGSDRLSSELDRTCAQLRLLATTVADRSFRRPSIDPADPEWGPPARPDVRRLLDPLGPVAVFAAGNFPLAFSVAGNDTSSALAAGCPVVVKGHPGHPGTSELVGRVVGEAVSKVGLPPGTFSLLHGASNEVGQALVQAAPIAAVAFTGSLAGGRALFDAAATRPRPIPVFAEMGSINPVVVSPGAMSDRGPAVARGFVGSLLAGYGQFCTKPGIVFVPESAVDAFVSDALSALGDSEPGHLLGARIRDGLEQEIEATLALPDVEVAGELAGPSKGITAPVRLLRTTAAVVARHEQLRREHFGPVGIVASYESYEEVGDVLRTIDGVLAAAFHATDAEADALRPLWRLARRRAGRLLWNGWPTGVAVTYAMHHGGPYPATTDARFTSVGVDAIHRFLRPVAFQDHPDTLLPDELRESNPLGVRRLLEGQWQA